MPKSSQRSLQARLLRGIVLAVGLFLAGGVVVPLFIQPNPRLLATRTPADVGLQYESVSFSPPDLPIPLHAWLIPATEPKATLVMAHGGGEDNRSLPYGEGLELIRDLVARRYSVLTLDLRNFGESGATPDGRLSFGVGESNDVIGALDYLLSRDGGARLGAIGFSMGGSSVLYAASRDVRLEAVVSDSAFADSAGIITSFVHASAGIPPWLSTPFLWTADTMHGLGLRSGRAIDVIAGIAPRPLLIVHDKSDPIVPVEHARRLASACKGSELWITDVARPQDGAFGTHIKSYMYGRQAYIDRIVAFLDQTFAPGPALGKI